MKRATHSFLSLAKSQPLSYWLSSVKRTAVFALAGLYACSLLADTLALKPNHPDTYVVKKGDTLWHISNVFLQSPWHWPEIWQNNPKVANPHLIYPGDRLTLVWIDGKPRLMVAQQGGNDNGSSHMSPNIRASSLDSAIPAIPLEKINAFLSKSRITDSATLDAAPYVVAGDGKHLLSGVGDKLYARGDFSDDNKLYGVYRKGDVFVDPDSGETLGIEALEIGAGRVITVENTIANMAVNESREEIRINDRLLPTEEKKITAMFYPKAPSKPITGVLLSVEKGVSQVGPMNIITINKGAREGLEVGDILAIHQAGETVKDKVKNEVIRLPDVRAGLLMVFRTFDKMSYGLVMSADRPLRLGDKVTNP